MNPSVERFPMKARNPLFIINFKNESYRVVEGQGELCLSVSPSVCSSLSMITYFHEKNLGVEKSMG